MPEKQDGSGLLSDSDKAIYQYLDEMLSDPGEGSGSAAPATSATPVNKATDQPPPAADKARSPSLNPVAKAVASETPRAVTKPQSSTPEPRSLPFKEKPQTKVLSNPESLLKFEKPIVVQQAPIAEKAAEKTAEKVTTKTAAPVDARAPVKTDTATAPKTRAPAATTEARQQLEARQQPQDPQTTVPPATTLPETTGLDQVVESQEGDERLPPMTPWCDNGRPQWAQERFECLLFEVAGLKLAVPLVTLGAVHQIDRKFRSLPGQYDWFIGILQTNLGNIKVIDTALCVMPERYDRSNREQLEFVITLHGFAWGISCHKLLKSITLEPEDVKWRTQRGKRPWMAGTVVEQMCALVDPAGFHHVILEAENREK